MSASARGDRRYRGRVVAPRRSTDVAPWIPPTPHNCTVWHTYVGRESGTQDRDRPPDRENAAFTATACDRLHRQYVAEHDIGNIEQVRSNLNKILFDVGTSLSDAGSDIAGFRGHPRRIRQGVDANNDLTNIRQMLQEL